MDRLFYFEHTTEWQGLKQWLWIDINPFFLLTVVAVITYMIIYRLIGKR